MNKSIRDFELIRETFIKALEKFPADKVDEKLFGEWNLKDVVAHFVGWDKEFTMTLHAFQKNEKHEYWGKIYELNEKVVTESKKSSWQKVFNEFKKSGKEFIESYTDFPEDLLNTKVWKDKIYTPIRILEINIHHYQKAQLIQITKLLNKWGL